MLWSFLLASFVRSPEAKEVWCHNTDSDEAVPLSMPIHTDYATYEPSLSLCRIVPWPFRFLSLKKTLKKVNKDIKKFYFLYMQTEWPLFYISHILWIIKILLNIYYMRSSMQSTTYLPVLCIQAAVKEAYITVNVWWM